MKRIAVEEHFLTGALLSHLRTRKEWPRLEAVEDDQHNKVDRMYWAPSHYFVHNDLDMVRRIVDIGEGRLKDMDESGIDMQVLVHLYPRGRVAGFVKRNSPRKANQ